MLKDDYSNETGTEQARKILPLRRLMEQRGRGPTNGHWDSFPACPYCQGKNCAGIFPAQSGNLELFKCHRPDCPSGTAIEGGAWNEVKFLAYELQCSPKEAFVFWLKEAGLWQETPSVPGQPANKESLTESSEASELNDSVADENERVEDSPHAPNSVIGASEDISSGGASGGQSPPLRAVAAIRRFFELIKLTDEDRTKLWKERGLTSETCDVLGFRSSVSSNRDILLALKDEFPIAVLLEAALWILGDEPGSEPKPNRQFAGWGVVGKSKNNPDEFEWGMTNPVLIPYVDAQNEVIDLRPHKRAQRGQSPRLYIPRPLKEYRDKYAGKINPQFSVFAESEFKSAALFQVIGEQAAIAGLPGIAMAKQLFGDIEDWLYDLGLRRVIVAFDNECKDNPNFPGFKEDPNKRYDAEVWARFLCNRIALEGYDSLVGHLPDAWRDAKGKCDWDGALAMLIGQTAHALNVSGLPVPEVWERVAGTIRAEFLQVLKAAVHVSEIRQAGIFDSMAEHIIHAKIERISREPELPVGGDDTDIIARRLQRMGNKLKNDEDRLPLKARAFLFSLAKKHLKLKGRYYVLKDLKDDTLAKWEQYEAKAHSRDDVELKRACEIVLRGIPQHISDFFVKPEFVLVKVNGKRERLLTLHNVHGKSSKLTSLPSAQFAQPSKLREWLLDSLSGSSWAAGERELNRLQADISAALSHREVFEIAIRGYDDEKTHMWFYGDVAYTPDCKEIFANQHGVIWHQGQGYRLSDKDQEGEPFIQKEPMMHPQVPFMDQQTCELFQNISHKLFDTIGGYGGYIALGSTLAYGAGPEIYKEFNAFPGLWIHGEPYQGKTSVARWLVRVWGWMIHAGMQLPDSTKVGLSILLQQQGNLPAWLEEYQHDCPDWILQKIKGVFNRESGGKKTFGEERRRIRTSVIITGVATCHESQVRSRYCHVHVAEANRIKDHYDWFEANATSFYLIGRYIMRNRTEFARLFMDQMQCWMKTQAVARVEHRSRIVHGVPYAAFAALAGMLQSHTADDLRKFRDYLTSHCLSAAKEVQTEVVAYAFFPDIVAGNSAHIFGHTPSERGTMFRAIVDPNAPMPPMSEKQRQDGIDNPFCAWKPGTKLCIVPAPVLDALRKHCHVTGRQFPPERSDLLAYLKVCVFWVEPGPDKNRAHRVRFYGSKTCQVCWIINLDLFPELGYRQVSDEEWEASFIKPDGSRYTSDEWTDPRRGELFVLVDSLKPQKSDE